MRKPNLLILSHVLPIPAESGQQQRIYYLLKTLRHAFDLTFATISSNGQSRDIENQLSEFCKHVVCLPSLYGASPAARIRHKALAQLKSVKTGLKPSNYIIGDLELSAERLASRLTIDDYDCVLYEYWHASKSSRIFREKKIPSVLDMHNILWQTYLQRQKEQIFMPEWWKKRQLNKYICAEEASWQRFDALVTINSEEHRYITNRLQNDQKFFYAPMGIDLDNWNYDWRPHQLPRRVAYYGGLDSSHNQNDALKCYEQIMPIIWRECPDTELWLIGSNPPRRISEIAKRDSRVKVTGFIEDVQSVLRTMSVVICPWAGKYGFRSRLVEVMALGVPLVTTADAIYGMEFDHDREILLATNAEEFALKCLSLLINSDFARKQSQLARLAIEKLYSLDNTYGKFTNELFDWLERFRFKETSINYYAVNNKS